MAKRYYWLKLKDDFFRQLPIKKLRRIAGGDTYTVIYLKMMLITTKTDGIIGYDGATDAEFIENLALDIDEDENNVKITCNFLLKEGLMVPKENGDMLLPEAKNATGSEGAGAQRMRELRQRRASQCDKLVTAALQVGDGEKEIEIELEKEIEVDADKDAGTKANSGSSNGSKSINQIFAVEQALGFSVTPMQAKQFMALFTEVGEYAFNKALQRAAEKNARNFKYVAAAARGIAAGDDYDKKQQCSSGGIAWEEAERRFIGGN